MKRLTQIRSYFLLLYPLVLWSSFAEFPNAWIKEKIGLRQFRLRGLVKVAREALWVCLTYNIQQWIRLVWRPQRLTATTPAS